MFKCSLYSIFISHDSFPALLSNSAAPDNHTDVPLNSTLTNVKVNVLDREDWNVGKQSRIEGWYDSLGEGEVDDSEEGKEVAGVKIELEKEETVGKRNVEALSYTMKKGSKRKRSVARSWKLEPSW